MFIRNYGGKITPVKLDSGAFQFQCPNWRSHEDTCPFVMAVVTAPSRNQGPSVFTID